MIKCLLKIYGRPEYSAREIENVQERTDWSNMNAKLIINRGKSAKVTGKIATHTL